MIVRAQLQQRDIQDTFGSMASSLVALLLTLLLVVVHGLSSSNFEEYQEQWLNPKTIYLANDNGAVNVTVKYDSPRQVTPLWWVNGKLGVDGDDGLRTDVADFGFETPHNGVGNSYTTASIRIPESFQIESLQLQLAGKSIDVTISINAVAISPGKSMLEYIPTYEYKVTPKDRVIYNAGDPILVRTTFKTKDIGHGTWHGLTAEFTSINDCITPPRIQTKTAKSDPEFLEVYTPTLDDDLNLDELFAVDKPRYNVRRVNVNYNSSGDLPRGILKVTNGFSLTRSCVLFAGVRVTYMLFLQPPPASHFFAEKSVVFDKVERNYYVENGGDIDVELKAFGGSEIEDIWGETLYEYPNITLMKSRQKVEPVADIKRYFEREVHFRFRSVTSTQAGRYLAVAKMKSRNGTGRAKADFNINVLNAI
ncbi:uncharacterized protein [Haliotis asinina]|uniref:uncharacterized protein n=1 Tax=Haliotis asinina TaxID=109174 RepID=UPI00353212E8